MFAKSLIFWTITAFMGLSAAMMLVPLDPPVATLETGLGPAVTTETL